MILKPVKIAVIGTEGYSWQLIKRIMSVPLTGVVTAVTSVDATSPGAQFCHGCGIPIFATLGEMLDAGGFEVVINSTPIHLHATMTEQCLAAGFAVWMEKPPVAVIQDFDRLHASAKQHNAAISVGFNSLYSHLTQNLKTELVAGRYGNVLRVKGIGAWIRTSDYFHRNNWAGRIRMGDDWILDGGLNNALSHVLCNNLYFAAPTHHALAEPHEIEAELYRCNNIESEDTSCVRILTRGKVEILTYLTLSTRREIPATTVIETQKAIITFEDFKRVQIKFRDGTTEEREAYQEDRIEMLQHLCRALRNNDDYFGSLNILRPFTVAVNGAFDSAGEIRTIPEKYLEKSSGTQGEQVNIKDIDHVMHDAFRKNQLYSEMGLPWAVKGHKLDTSNYTSFPGRFRESESATTVLVNAV